MATKTRLNVVSPALVVLPVGIALALSLLGDLALFASLPANVDVVGISVTNLGLVFSVHRLIRIPGNAIGGILINPARRRPFFLMGMVLAVVSTLGYGLSHNLGFMILARLCWGIAWILLYISSITMLIDVTNKQNRGKWVGIYNTWYLIGIAGGSLLGGVLSDWIGFQKAMFLCSALTFIGLLEAAVYLPETFSPKGTDETFTGKSVPKKAFALRFSGLEELFSRPGIPLVMFTYLVNQFAAEGVALSVLSILLKNRFGSEVYLGSVVLGIISLSGFLLALRYVLSASLSPLLGAFSDKDQRGRFQLLLLGLVISVLSFFSIGYGQQLWTVLTGILLNAIGGAGLLASLSALLGDLSPQNQEGKVTGMYATAGDVGSALGPMFAYFLLAIFHISIVFTMCAVLFLLCMLLTWLTWRKRVDTSV
jgi:MFS family permease